MAVDARLATRTVPALSRRARLQLLWLKIHRWIGLSLLAVFAALAITGSLLVWPDHFDRMVNPERYPADPHAAPAAPSVLVASARSVLAPGDTVSAIRYPQGISGVIVAGQVSGPPPMSLGPPSRTMVWLEPADGSVLAHVDRAGGFQWALRAIHGHLLLASAGREVLAIAGIVLLVSAGSGLWLWWPGLRHIGRALAWRRSASISMNLHRQTGALIVLILIVETFTGIYVTVPNWFAPIVEPGSTVAEHLDGPPVGRTLAEPQQDIDRVLTLARAELPDARVASLFLPDEIGRRWTVNFATADGERAVHVADSDAAVSLSAAETPGRAERIEHVMADIHFGQYGVIWQLIVFLSGIVLTLLSITGLLLWLQGRRRRARRAQPA